MVILDAGVNLSVQISYKNWKSSAKCKGTLFGVTPDESSSIAAAAVAPAIARYWR